MQTAFHCAVCSSSGFSSLTSVSAALHYYSVTAMNRPWPAAITLLTKYLPSPREEARLQQDVGLSLFLHDFWGKIF